MTLDYPLPVFLHFLFSTVHCAITSALPWGRASDRNRNWPSKASWTQQQESWGVTKHSDTHFCWSFFFHQEGPRENPMLSSKMPSFCVGNKSEPMELGPKPWLRVPIILHWECSSTQSKTQHSLITLSIEVKTSHWYSDKIPLLQFASTTRVMKEPSRGPS